MAHYATNAKKVLMAPWDGKYQLSVDQILDVWRFIGRSLFLKW